MYKVIMVSPGGVKRDLHGGFETEMKAEEYAAETNYEYCDENGFVWRLEVVEDIAPTANLVIPNKSWAETFLKFRTHGDDQALNYLDMELENSLDRNGRLRFIAIRRLVQALLPLNHVISLMEMGEIDYDDMIEHGYSTLMTRLDEIALKAGE